jgi:bile acid:Na+ symporter, BASS family
MTIDQLTSVLVTITLIAMMVGVGLGVSFAELMDVARNWRLVARAALGNYVCVPAITVGLLLLFGTRPMVAAGFLILAVCPGAPFGPPCTALARGNVTASAGVMVLLAASSALLAPVLLSGLLPLVVGGEGATVDSVKIVATLVFTQIAPLAAGLAFRQWRPALAERLRKPAGLVSHVLSLFVVGLILATQYPGLMEIQERGLAGMVLLLIASLAVGWLLGGPDKGDRKALALTTSLRNVGVGLVIAAGSFVGDPDRGAALTAILAYGLLEIFGSLLLALAWGRQPPAENRDAGAERDHLVKARSG